MLQDTPYHDQLQIERVARLARFNAAAVPDRPIRILSASQRAEEAPDRPFKAAATRHALTKSEVHALVWPSIPVVLPSSFAGPKIILIQEIVAGRYHLTRKALLERSRTANVILPRQIAMYLAKTLTLRSLPEIGRHFGGRDHTTVISAIKKIIRKIETDATLAAEIENLRIQITEATA